MIAYTSLCGAEGKADYSLKVHDSYKKQIGQVLEEFRAAIVAKDRESLTKLAFSGTIPCVPVLDAASLVNSRAKNPRETRASLGSYAEFVDSIVLSTEQDQENFSNITILTDGTIANVYFEYTFSVDGKVTNGGHETWALVNTDDGWKITSIIWSIALAPQKS
jgi:hypothetical protein